MAKNWLAYEACEVLLTGADKEAMSEIGSRFPLFTVAVLKDGTKSLLDILKALPKVTARVVETGLKDSETEEKDVEESDETETKEEPKKEKKVNKKSKKAEKESEPEDEDEDEDEENEELDTDKPYESMSAKELYKLCCERGISSHCKSRSKDKLIEVLEKFDNGELETSNRKKDKEEPKKTNKKAKKEEPKEDDEDEWDEEDEEHEESDPYKGKTAKELYKMCTDRGIKVKPKQNAEAYAKLLKKADEAENEEDEAEDEDDDWEI